MLWCVTSFTWSDRSGLALTCAPLDDPVNAEQLDLGLVLLLLLVAADDPPKKCFLSEGSATNDKRKKTAGWQEKWSGRSGAPRRFPTKATRTVPNIPPTGPDSNQEHDSHARCSGPAGSGAQRMTFAPAGRHLAAMVCPRSLHAHQRAPLARSEARAVRPPPSPSLPCRTNGV